MKQNPYLKTSGKHPVGYFPKRDSLFVIVGNVGFKGFRALLNIGDTDIIWLSQNDNKEYLLNINIRNKDGQAVWIMNDNNWETFGVIDDLECAASAHKLRLIARSQKIDIEIEYNVNANNDTEASCRIKGMLIWPAEVLLSTSQGIYYPETQSGLADLTLVGTDMQIPGTAIAISPKLRQ